MRHNDGTFTFSKLAAKAILSFATADTTRPHLCALHFDPQTGCAYATDGHALVKVQNCGRSDHEAFTVARVDFAQAVRAARKKGDRVLVSLDGDRVRLEARGPEGQALDAHGGVIASFDAPRLLDKYPPVEQVIPHTPTGYQPEGVGFNALLLERIALIQKAAEADGCRFMVGAAFDPAKVVIDSPATGSTWTAVIMPMRI